MILTDRQIIEAQGKGEIAITGFDEKQVQAAIYDLCVGDQLEWQLLLQLLQ